MAGLETESTLTSYDPSWRDQAAQALMGSGLASPERAAVVGGMLGSRGVGSTGMGLVDATPAGVPFALNDAYRSAKKGNYGTAALEAAAAFPAIRGLKAVTQWAAGNSARQLARPGPQGGLDAYHGTTQNIERFDSSRSGTGIGQAFGAGIYLTESPKVAERYAEILASRGGMPASNTQRVYNTKIDARAEDMLDLNAPLRAQSENIQKFINTPSVRKALDARVARGGPSMLDASGNWVPLKIKDPTGNELVTALRDAAEASTWQKLLRASGLGTSPEIRAKNQLQAAGIPGARYRAHEPGSTPSTRNYIVYDDNLVDIVR